MAAATRDCRPTAWTAIDVRLLWNQTDDQIVVAVFDAKTREAFEIEIEAREALEAIRHPYAHAAFRGVDYHPATGHRAERGSAGVALWPR